MTSSQSVFCDRMLLVTCVCRDDVDVVRAQQQMRSSTAARDETGRTDSPLRLLSSELLLVTENKQYLVEYVVLQTFCPYVGAFPTT